jgi:tetratricopeptide (TPR) repeat protein
LRPDRSALAEQVRDLSTADQLASEGWDLYGKGDVEGAQVKLAAAVDAGSQSVWIHYARGLAEYALGHFEVAAESWEFVRRHEPTHEPVYFDLTDAYLSLDRPADAQAVLEDAARRWPRDPEAHNALGVVLFSRGRVDDAISTFLRAVEVAPDDGLSHFNLGRAYHGRMIRWQASRTIQTASATSALADRDRQSAIREYQRALALGGTFEWDARDALRLLGG